MGRGGCNCCGDWVTTAKISKSSGALLWHYNYGMDTFNLIPMDDYIYIIPRELYGDKISTNLSLQYKKTPTSNTYVTAHTYNHESLKKISDNGKYTGGTRESLFNTSQRDFLSEPARKSISTNQKGITTQATNGRCLITSEANVIFQKDEESAKNITSYRDRVNGSYKSMFDKEITIVPKMVFNSTTEVATYSSDKKAESRGNRLIYLSDDKLLTYQKFSKDFQNENIRNITYGSGNIITFDISYDSKNYEAYFQKFRFDDITYGPSGNAISSPAFGVATNISPDTSTVRTNLKVANFDIDFDSSGYTFSPYTGINPNPLYSSLVINSFDITHDSFSVNLSFDRTNIVDAFSVGTLLQYFNRTYSFEADITYDVYDLTNTYLRTDSTRGIFSENQFHFVGTTPPQQSFGNSDPYKLYQNKDIISVIDLETGRSDNLYIAAMLSSTTIYEDIADSLGYSLIDITDPPSPPSYVVTLTPDQRDDINSGNDSILNIIGLPTGILGVYVYLSGAPISTYYNYYETYNFYSDKYGSTEVDFDCVKVGYDSGYGYYAIVNMLVTVMAVRYVTTNSQLTHTPNPGPGVVASTRIDLDYNVNVRYWPRLFRRLSKTVKISFDIDGTNTSYKFLDFDSSDYPIDDVFATYSNAWRDDYYDYYYNVFYYNYIDEDYWVNGTRLSWGYGGYGSYYRYGRYGRYGSYYGYYGYGGYGGYYGDYYNYYYSRYHLLGYDIYTNLYGSYYYDNGYFGYGGYGYGGYGYGYGGYGNGSYGGYGYGGYGGYYGGYGGYGGYSWYGAYDYLFPIVKIERKFINIEKSNDKVFALLDEDSVKESLGQIAGKLYPEAGLIISIQLSPIVTYQDHTSETTRLDYRLDYSTVNFANLKYTQTYIPIDTDYLNTVHITSGSYLTDAKYRYSLGHVAGYDVYYGYHSYGGGWRSGSATLGLSPLSIDGVNSSNYGGSYSIEQDINNLISEECNTLTVIDDTGAFNKGYFIPKPVCLAKDTENSAYVGMCTTSNRVAIYTDVQNVPVSFTPSYFVKSSDELNIAVNIGNFNFYMTAEREHYNAGFNSWAEGIDVSKAYAPRECIWLIPDFNRETIDIANSKSVKVYIEDKYFELKLLDTAEEIKDKVLALGYENIYVYGGPIVDRAVCIAGFNSVEFEHFIPGFATNDSLGCRLRTLSNADTGYAEVERIQYDYITTSSRGTNNIIQIADDLIKPITVWPHFYNKVVGKLIEEFAVNNSMPYIRATEEEKRIAITAFENSRSGKSAGTLISQDGFLTPSLKFLGSGQTTYDYNVSISEFINSQRIPEYFDIDYIKEASGNMSVFFHHGLMCKVENSTTGFKSKQAGLMKIKNDGDISWLSDYGYKPFIQTKDENGDDLVTSIEKNVHFNGKIQDIKCHNDEVYITGNMINLDAIDPKGYSKFSDYYNDVILHRFEIQQKRGSSTSVPGKRLYDILGENRMVDYQNNRIHDLNDPN